MARHARTWLAFPTCACMAMQARHKALAGCTNYLLAAALPGCPGMQWNKKQSDQAKILVFQILAVTRLNCSLRLVAASHPHQRPRPGTPHQLPSPEPTRTRFAGCKSACAPQLLQCDALRGPRLLMCTSHHALVEARGGGRRLGRMPSHRLPRRLRVGSLPLPSGFLFGLLLLRVAAGGRRRLAGCAALAGRLRNRAHAHAAGAAVGRGAGGRGAPAMRAGAGEKVRPRRVTSVSTAKQTVTLHPVA